MTPAMPVDGARGARRADARDAMIHRSRRVDARARASRAMREGEVANAVSFLRHPSVAQSADEGKKRAFLEGKGLTGVEIDEAFRRAVGTEVDGARARSDANGTRERVSKSGSVLGGVLRLGALAGGAYLAYPSARRLLERARAAYAERGGGKSEDGDGRATASVATPVVTPVVSTPVAEGGVTPDLAKRIERVLESAERAEAKAEEMRNEMRRDVLESVRDLKLDLEAQLRSELSELKRVYAESVTDSPLRLASSSSAQKSTGEWPFKPSPPESESDEGALFTPDTHLKPSREEPPMTTPLDNYFSALKPKERVVDPPHPGNFMDILEMLENGKTPPGIKDIDDTPPNPNAAIPSSSDRRPGKPWDLPPVRVNSRAFGEEDVPIKRVQVESPADKPWRPPPAPELSKMMSSGAAPTSPRSPHRSRSIDHKFPVEEEAGHSTKVQI